MRRRYELLNHLIQKNNYKFYLEIGVEDPRRNFNAISADIKFSVDPNNEFRPNYCGTSDKFFELNNERIRFDIIFVDGLHEADQVYRDIENSFKILMPGGTIVMHDCLPRKEVEQHVPRQQEVWTGDVWKAFVRFRENHPYIKMRVVNMDMGMGVLAWADKKSVFKAEHELSYLNFTKYYKEWLNLISVEEFLNEAGELCRCRCCEVSFVEEKVICKKCGKLLATVELSRS